VCAQAEKRAPTRVSQNYIAGARKFLAPVLMETMCARGRSRPAPLCGAAASMPRSACRFVR
jgi:hypothetical protein